VGAWSDLGDDWGVVYSDARSSPLGRGRPRSVAADEKILDAAMELLIERGYEGATIGAVAMRARVGSKTIYRRYANRVEMLAAAIDERLGLRPVENTGNTLQDLRGMVSMLAGAVVRGPGMRLLGVVLAEERRHPELLAAYRRRGVWPRRRLLRAVLERAVRRGDVRGDVDLDVAVDVVWGAAFARYVSGVRDETDFVDGVVDAVWRGVEGIRDGSES